MHRKKFKWIEINIVILNPYIRRLSKCFASGTFSYLMDRRLPNSCVDDCLGYFRCLCVVYGYVIAFKLQKPKNVETRIHSAVF